MGTRTLLVALAPLPLLGCLVRAPTTHELDRRAGLLAEGRENALAQVRTSSAVARAAEVPVRLPPLVEKVWVSDLPLGPDARLQGTWLYLEVDRGRWLDEVDPGGAPLLDLERSAARPTSAPASAPQERAPAPPPAEGHNP
jgi:hypothetical protein